MTYPAVKRNTASLKSALANSQVQETGHSASGSVGYLRFDFKSGDFYFGKDQEEVTGVELAVNTASITHGWVLWTGGKCTKSLVPFNQPIPEPMPSVGQDHPGEGRGFEARFFDSDDETTVAFETNSYGGRKGVDTLLSQIKAQAVVSDFIFPIVKLNSESYKAKTGGTIHNPVFEITGWMDAEGNVEGESKQLTIEDAQEEADEPEAASEVTTRRRRRVA